MKIKRTSKNVYTIRHGKNNKRENFVNRTKIGLVKRDPNPEYPEIVIVVIEKNDGNYKGFCIDAKTREEATWLIDILNAWKYRFSN